MLNVPINYIIHKDESVLKFSQDQCEWAFYTVLCSSVCFFGTIVLGLCGKILVTREPEEETCNVVYVRQRQFEPSNYAYHCQSKPELIDSTGDSLADCGEDLGDEGCAPAVQEEHVGAD